MWLDLGVRNLVNNTSDDGVCITLCKLRHVPDHFMTDVAHFAENLQCTAAFISRLDAVLTVSQKPCPWNAQSDHAMSYSIG